MDNRLAKAFSTTAKSSMSVPAKHVFLTGQPGVGKSTLIARVLDVLASQRPDIKSATCGFWTEEVRQAGERTGFKMTSIDGLTGTLAKANSDVPVCMN